MAAGQPARVRKGISPFIAIMLAVLAIAIAYVLVCVLAPSVLEKTGVPNLISPAKPASLLTTSASARSKGDGKGAESQPARGEPRSPGADAARRRERPPRPTAPPSTTTTTP